MNGKLIAFPVESSEATSHARDATSSHEAPTTARARPARASLASELRPLRRARTARDDGAVVEHPRSSRLPSPAPVARIVRTADDAREVSGEIDTAARRDPPTMGERIRAEPARVAGPLRELGAAATPGEPEVRGKKPAVRVLVGGRVLYVGWV